MFLAKKKNIHNVTPGSTEIINTQTYSLNLYWVLKKTQVWNWNWNWNWITYLGLLAVMD